MNAKKERRTILTTIFVIVSLGLSVGSASSEDIICNGETCRYPGGDYGYIIVKNDGKLTIDGNVSCKQIGQDKWQEGKKERKYRHSRLAV